MSERFYGCSPAQAFRPQYLPTGYAPRLERRFPLRWQGEKRRLTAEGKVSFHDRSLMNAERQRAPRRAKGGLTGVDGQQHPAAKRLAGG